MKNKSLQLHIQLLEKMKIERSAWFSHWRTVSEFFLPRRYPSLSSDRERRTVDLRNTRLLSSVSTLAVRTLATGLQDGITSPARPWFRLRLSGFKDDELSQNSKIWLEEVTNRIRMTLAESNFYDSLALLYLDWACFGTTCMDIRPDFEEVIRFYPYAPGSFYLSQDETRRVNRVARDFSLTVEQIVSEFGEDKVSLAVKDLAKKGGGGILQSRTIYHIIEKNNPKDNLLKVDAPFREVYWEKGEDSYLAVRPLQDWPAVTPRWELVGNDVYGISPAMEALPDVIQLQSMIKKKNIGLDKQITPPLIADTQLRNRPKAFSSGGITYASTANSNFGARPLFQMQLPLQEMNLEEKTLSLSIRETMFNHLFNGISQLDTVRSATEVIARDQERLVLLGPVLGRFENEGLDVILRRVFSIMERSDLLPSPPPEIMEQPVTVQYVSILSDAQRAVGVASTERFFQFTAELSGVYPELRYVPNAEELLRDYAERTGVVASGIRDREDTAELIQQEREAAQAQEQQAQMQQDIQGAKLLSDTDVGGGQNALQKVVG